MTGNRPHDERRERPLLSTPIDRNGSVAPVRFPGKQSLGLLIVLSGSKSSNVSKWGEIDSIGSGQRATSASLRDQSFRASAYERVTDGYWPTAAERCCRRYRPTVDQLSYCERPLSSLIASSRNRPVERASGNLPRPRDSWTTPAAHLLTWRASCRTCREADDLLCARFRAPGNRRILVMGGHGNASMPPGRCRRPAT